jgi:hypothetical protein
MTPKAAAQFRKVKAMLATETVWGRPLVREWRRGDLARLYWPDGSFIYVDGAGGVRSSGGAATRAKIAHGLR